MNSLVVNTVPDDIVKNSDATIAASSTASSRLYVEYLFQVNVDQAYEYAENSTLTPEERVGMFYMRSRIAQIELEKKRKVVSLNYTFISKDSGIQKKTLKASCSNQSWNI